MLALIPLQYPTNKMQLCAQVNRPVVSRRIVWGLPGTNQNRFPGASQALYVWVSCETGIAMLWTILIVLCVLWLLGVVTSYTLGGFIHVLLLVALAIFVINLIQGRKRPV
jgi:hypothetical protein